MKKVKLFQFYFRSFSLVYASPIFLSLSLSRTHYVAHRLRRYYLFCDVASLSLQLSIPKSAWECLLGSTFGEVDPVWALRVRIVESLY